MSKRMKEKPRGAVRRGTLGGQLCKYITTGTFLWNGLKVDHSFKVTNFDQPDRIKLKAVLGIP